MAGLGGAVVFVGDAGAVVGNSPVETGCVESGSGLWDGVAVIARRIVV